MRRGYLTAPVIIILAIITLAVAFVIYFNTNLIKQAKNEQPEEATSSSEIYISGLTFFLKENSTQKNINQLIQELKETKGVFDAKYISPEEALKLYKEKYCTEGAELEEYCDDILVDSIPQSIDVSLNPSDAEQIEIKFEKHPLIEKIRKFIRSS